MGYLQKYLFKPVFLVFVAVILVTLIISISLEASKGKIELLLNKYLGLRLSVGRIYYLPLNFIILKDVSIHGASLSSQPLFVKKATLAFSVRELISKRSFTVTKIYLNGPKVISSSSTSFLERDIEEIIIGAIDFLASRRSLKLEIKNGLLVSPREENLTTRIAINSTSKLEAGSLSSSGSIGLEGPSLDYSFKGHLIKEGITIENLEFRRANFYTKFWGELERNVLRLNGYSLRSPEAPVTIIDRFKRGLRYRRKPVAKIIKPTMVGLDFFDLDCVIKLVPQRIQIENLSFFLNKNFVKAKGYLEEGKFSGKVSFCFLRMMKGKMSQVKIEADFKNLAFYSARDQRLKMSSEELALTLADGANFPKIFLENFNALFDLKDERVKIVKFNSMIYDGILEGEWMVEVSQTRFRCPFNLMIKDVSINRLSSLPAYFPRGYGKLASQIHYRNYPHSNLKGKLVISDGCLEELEFFKWLADFFEIPALKKVDYNELSVDFSIDGEIVNLSKISIDSEEVKLDGHFSLQENDLVFGKLSLTISKELLGTSPKFKSLARILGEDVHQISFPFQISGLFDAMNFKWLESDFRRTLQDLLPDAKKVKIEEKIGEAIEFVPQEEEKEEAPE